MIQICVNIFQILDKVHMQFQTFMDDPMYSNQHDLHLELVATLGRVGPNAEPRFRDECKSANYVYICLFTLKFLAFVHADFR